MDLGPPSEKLRKILLNEELKLRKKQPEHWAKTKYRKYAKPYTPEELERVKELDSQRHAEEKKPGKEGKKKRKKKPSAG